MDTLTRQGISRIRNIADDIERNTTRETHFSAYAGYLGLSSREKQSYSVFDALRKKLESIKRNIAGLDGCRMEGIEAECHEMLCKRLGVPVHPGTLYIPTDILAYVRDLTVANLGDGGSLVGTTNRSFIDTLRAVSVTSRLGVQSMPGQRENVTLPKQKTSATVKWLTNEADTATESTASFGQAAGTPKTASAYTELSELLIRQSNPSAEAIVLNGLAADLAVGKDIAVLNGSGVAGEPTGIIQTPGIGTATGTTLGYAGLVGAQTSVATANAILNPHSLGYCTTPAVAGVLKGRPRFTNTDSPLWQGAVHEGEIEGVKALSTSGMPTASMVYGDWSQLVVAEWGVLAVEVNPFADFQKRVVGVRALWSVDVMCLHPESFLLISSIT